jgi:2-oxoglutarate ferredoxin oxidoreductase subunit gamma
MKILIAGEGGQGVQLIAEVLARTAYKLSKYSLYIPNFGVEQRGGVSIAFVQIDSHPIAYPKFKEADFMVLMCQRAKERVRPHLGKTTHVISLFELAQIDFPPRVHNVFVLGMLLKKIGLLSLTAVENTLDEILQKKSVKDEGIIKVNFEALKAGYNAGVV